MKKTVFSFLVCMMVCVLWPGSIVKADMRTEVPIIEPAVAVATFHVNKNLHNEYSKKTYAYQKNEAYNRLDKTKKQLYNEMYKKIKNLEPFSYAAKKYGYDKLDMVLEVWGSISQDHPEIDDYFMIADIIDEEKRKTASLDAKYYYSWDQNTEPIDMAYLKGQIALVDECANYIVKQMPKNLSAYDKYRYLAYAISLITDYSYDGYMTSAATPYGVLIRGKSVCQGYAKAMQYLCQKANLYCKFVSGSSEGVGHAWNLVKLSTGTYYIDITWADGQGMVGTKDWMKEFMVTQKVLEADKHEISDKTVATGKLNYNANASTKTAILKMGATYKDVKMNARYKITGTSVEDLKVTYMRPDKRTAASVTIPKNLVINGNTYKITAINKYAFKQCTELKKIVVKSQKITSVGEKALADIDKKAKIYFPKSKLKAYKALFKNKGQKKTVTMLAA